MDTTIHQESISSVNSLWNKGKPVAQKKPFKPREIWAIRTRLQIDHKLRELALFNLALDSKLRGYDIVLLTVQDITSTGNILSRAMVIQQKRGSRSGLKSRIRLEIPNAKSIS